MYLHRDAIDFRRYRGWELPWYADPQPTEIVVRYVHACPRCEREFSPLVHHHPYHHDHDHDRDRDVKEEGAGRGERQLPPPPPPPQGVVPSVVVTTG